jgi:opacity protein-like surface antigen
MCKFVIVFMMVLLFFSSSLAQSNDTYFERGSKALLFEFSGFDNLGANSFNGGIGGKYFIQSHMAIRGSIQFMSIDEDIPFQGTGGIDGDAQANRFGFSGALEIHVNNGRVNPYFGGGLGLSFTSTKSKTDEADPNDQVTIKNSRDGEFGYFGGTVFTVFGMVGVEIFVIENLSLAAEYRLGFANISRKDEEITQGNTTVTTKQGSIQGFGIESSGVLTLAVYF